MDIKQIKIDDIKPYGLNAKKHDQAQIDDVAKSIELFGFVQPLVIDGENVIIIGHCRFMAAQQMGLQEVPCVIADYLSDDEIKRLRIIDNKTNESDWDIDLLLQDIEDIDFSDFNFNFNFTEKEEITALDLDDQPKTEKDDKQTYICPKCGFEFGV